MLKYGTILNWPRNILCKINFFDKLFNCSLCLGFWCGVVVSLYTDHFDFVLLGFAGAAACWMSDCLINVLQSVEIKLDQE